MNAMSPPFHASFKPNPLWAEAVFSAKTVGRGGVVRRAMRDVEREIGRTVFVAEVRRRGFHPVECGGQFTVICNPGLLKVVC